MQSQTRELTELSHENRNSVENDNQRLFGGSLVVMF